ncbi:DUF3800 domain-containing protein [Sphingomonas sp. DT-204]|uniref:DUF3800 domain-containing protein n=1 Tax=Sphingomonas sp. DT-204 TaxID=3396166 RepID=UPI003F19C0C5
MTHQSIYNLYCDESCHIEGDGIPIMVLGCVWCNVVDTHRIKEQLKNIKRRHGLSPSFEIKWTKVSAGKIDFYTDVVEYFLTEPKLNFRGILIPDKDKLDHNRFSQSHDDWYYKMYFTMLKYIISPSNAYRIYLDVKDTRGGPKTRDLHSVLCNNIHDFNNKTVERVEQIRSHESEILQLTDLLIGAIGYANRELATSPAKQALLAQLRSRLSPKALTQTTSFSNTKFNLLVWAAQERSA